MWDVDRYVKAKIIQHVNSAMVIYGALSYFPRELKSINVIGASTSQMECFIPTAGNSVYSHFCIITVFYPWKADTEGSSNKKRFLDAYWISSNYPGQLVGHTFRLLSLDRYRASADHRTGYIFRKLWPTPFRLRFPKCIFATCTRQYASSELCEFIEQHHVLTKMIVRMSQGKTGSGAQCQRHKARSQHKSWI